MKRKPGGVLSVRQLESAFSVIRTLMAVSIALIIAYFLIWTVSANPGKDFGTLLFGPLRNTSSMISVISKYIPLLFTGTAVCLVYAANQINIAAEGAFFAGCFASTAVAIVPGIPAIIHIPLCVLVGGLAGAIVMGIPGILHVRYNVVTIVAALMMNYVSLYLGLYLILNPLRDPAANFESSYLFSESARMPTLFGEKRLHIGLFIGLAVVFLGYFVLYKTSFGYAARTIGSNQRFAQYSGVPVGKTIIMTSLLAGFFAGMGGTVETLGNYQRFVYPGFTNHGWDGIMLAVLCRNNPRFMPFAALFLAYLNTSADALNFSSKIPPEIISVIQAIIIIFIAAEKFLAGPEHKAIVRNSQKRLSIEKGE